MTPTIDVDNIAFMKTLINMYNSTYRELRMLISLVAQLRIYFMWETYLVKNKVEFLEAEILQFVL